MKIVNWLSLSGLVLVCLYTLINGDDISGSRELKFLRRKDARNLQRLTFRGNNPTFKLAQCEGDCDKDSDCVSGLVCFQKSFGGTGIVPGCSRTDTTANDYCIDPVDLNTPPSAVPPSPPAPTPVPATAPTPVAGNALFSYGRNPPSDAFPLAICEGDCDVDGDCAGDLVCYQRDSGRVPGCSGTPSSNLDYCIQLNPSPVTTPSPVPPSQPTPSSGLQNFKLKLYWQEGYFWQEESFERKWCMRCPGGACGLGGQLFIEECDDDGVQRFDFEYVSGDEVLIKLRGTGRCLQRLNRNIFVQNCNSGESLQRWWAKVGQFTENRFEISQKTATNLCVTQRHHPKSGETVLLEPCTQARSADTSFWERCSSDSC